MSLTQQQIEKLNDFLLVLSKKHQIAYEIYGLHRCLSYYCPISLSLDKQYWISRKRNSVLRFSVSTYDLSIKNNSNELAFLNKYGLQGSEFTLTPGSVPIKNSDNNLIGVITVTGLSPKEDHDLAKQALSKLNEI